ncbi:AcrVA2 family anti-CRISPR protein [Burkholderia ubonensis]|uniref:AcrVA2 family anti-CRISPR protein n=1 Tax=Burkholderia ubonensis TaxID=101571 RepID=UPI0008FE638A|nr:hypothetical protein [Burkholderia ubonensis]
MNAVGTTPTDLKGYSPLDCVVGVSRKFPELFAQLDRLRAMALAYGSPWSMPPHWYLPFHTTAKAVNDLLGQMDRLGMDVRRVPRSTPTLLNTLAAWRLTQGIYRFDETLFEALCATPVSGALPTDLFTRLPEWTVYVETPGFMWAGSALDGVFAQAGEIFDGTEGLAFVLNARTDMPMFVLRLDQPSLEAAIDVAINGDGGTEPALSAQMRSMLPRLVSLLLNLCSEAPELGDGTAIPIRPQPKRTHRGIRMMPARRPVRWNVGTRLGASLRAAWQSTDERTKSDATRGSQASPRAHIRRAHWHTILSGPRQSPIRSLRWLPPIPVNVTEPDDLARTIRPVTAS